LYVGPNLTPPPKGKDFVEPPHRKLKTYPTFDLQGNVIYQTINDPVPIDFDDGVDYDQYDGHEQQTSSETTTTPATVPTTERPQQLRQGLGNLNALNMLKAVHGNDQLDTNHNSDEN